MDTIYIFISKIIHHKHIDNLHNYKQTYKKLFTYSVLTCINDIDSKQKHYKINNSRERFRIKKWLLFYKNIERIYVFLVETFLGII